MGAQSGTRKRELGKTRTKTAAEWRAKTSSAQDIEVPSGNIALIRRVGPEAFLDSGNIPDALTPIIEESVRDAKGLRPEKAAELMNDPGMMPKAVGMMNMVVCSAVVEPHVESVPPCTICEGRQQPWDDVHLDRSHEGYHVYAEEDRDPEALYIDEVDFEDKVFIFNYAVGGTADLERFRKEQASSMAAVLAVQVDQDTA
jgi:hypothetical protein